MIGKVPGSLQSYHDPVHSSTRSNWIAECAIHVIDRIQVFFYVPDYLSIVAPNRCNAPSTAPFHHQMLLLWVSGIDPLSLFLSIQSSALKAGSTSASNKNGSDSQLQWRRY